MGKTYAGLAVSALLPSSTYFVKLNAKHKLLYCAIYKT